MKQGTGLAVGIIAVAVVAAGAGYWFGNRGAASEPAVVASTTRNIDSTPVNGQKQERKLLFYRNPMGLPDTSPTPKKDPMGMDYIAVYEGEADDEPVNPNLVKISTEKIQKLGVRTETAQLRTIDRTVRAAGRIEPDERRLFTITPKFEGYVERLHVNVTGQPVSKGQPLFEVYSPELVSAQREYAIARQGVESLKNAGGQAQEGMRQLAESSLQRLNNWDISPEQVKALVASGEAKRTLTFRSPVAGIVMEKKAQQGMRFMPGEALFQIADLSAVWVIAEVFEQDIGLIKTGAKAVVKINAYPDKEFQGRLTYIYPTLNAETRTVAVRVELANPGLLLKPAMFAQIDLSVLTKKAMVTVPLSAIIDSGTRQIVLIEQGQGRFEPRDVKLGDRGDNYVEILAGVTDGEKVVVAANFLIDAESNLKAAVSGFSSSTTSAGPAGSAAGHRAQGVVDSIDIQAGTLMLNHGPVASLKWPAMTMEFKAANGALLTSVKPGDKVDAEFVERQPGEWVITRMTPVAANAHAGH